MRPMPPRQQGGGSVEEIVRRSGTSFYWAMRFLQPVKRQAMFAIYAFCREVDDIVDEPGEVGEKLEALAGWRRQIDDLYRGRAASPVAAALLQPIAHFDLQQQDFLAIVDGMQMDAFESIRINDLAELGLYCDRVACAVGRLSVRVFGLPEPTGRLLAGSLGEALQLTNILRDLQEDADRNRLYLPRDLLLAHSIDVTAADARTSLQHPAIAEICAQIAQAAQGRFQEAAALTRACDRRSVKPAVVMMEVYRRTLQRLNDRGWQRWAEPVSVPSREKLWIALRYGMM